MKKQKIIIATRGSKLAWTQSGFVAELIRAANEGIDVELLKVVTTGDTDQTTPIGEFGGMGVFTKELENKLLLREADVAVHSLKDVPTLMHPDLQLITFPHREDPRDVLVTTHGINWRDLPEGSVVGTSSPARREQLKQLRPDLRFKEIRGNIDTRIRKMEQGDYDAIILAAAGMKRLGITIADSSYFSLDEMIPSPGQAALAIQVHRENQKVIDVLEKLNKPRIQEAVQAERTFMELIGGGCRFPIAAHCEYVSETEIIFRAMALRPGYKCMQRFVLKTTIDQLDAIPYDAAISVNLHCDSPLI